jgi:HAD superfamily phosphoserine phosphatase-like hydrolase
MNLKRFLLASDFDQTLSFNDSGEVLSEMLGIRHFEQKVRGLAQTRLVQQGGELAYLIRHDPEFRLVRKEHLVEAGRRVRLRGAIRPLVDFLAQGIPGYEFTYAVISAAPQEVVTAALADIVPADRIFGTQLEYDPVSGEVTAIRRVPAGYGKVVVLDELRDRFGIAPDRMIYVGDGSSDVHVMLHVNNLKGFTIAVSEHAQLARVARTTVLSDQAISILIPILHDLLGWQIAQIRPLFEAKGLTLQEWAHARTNRVAFEEFPLAEAANV